jgi:GR25 family glycosyltransferase involved in LPS biosynthesis
VQISLEKQLKLLISDAAYMNRIRSEKIPFRPHFFVINLQRRPERLRTFREQMGAAGIEDFEVVRGVDGSMLSEEDILLMIDKNATREAFGGRIHMTNGEIGCAASHNKIYEKIITERYSHGVVFEDDARTVENFQNFWESFAIDELDFDILILGYYTSPNNLIKINSLGKKIGKFEVVYFPELWHKNIDLYGTHSYIISYTGAKKMLSCNSKIKFVADEPWRLFCGPLKVLAVDPMIFEPFGPPGDIQRGTGWQMHMHDRIGLR